MSSRYTLNNAYADTRALLSSGKEVSIWSRVEDTDILKLLQVIPVLSGVRPEIIRRFAGVSQLLRYMPRDEVIGFEANPTGLFFVVEGCVQLVTPSHDGRKRVAELFEVGAMFGEIGVLTQEPSNMRALATDRTVLIHVDIVTVRAMLDLDLGLTRRLLDSMANRTQKLIDFIGATAPPSAEVRIAAYLCELSESEGRREGSLLLPAAKVTIASMLNMTPESLSRSFRRLIDKGIMKISGRHVFVVDWLRLARVAQRNVAA